MRKILVLAAFTVLVASCSSKNNDNAANTASLTPQFCNQPLYGTSNGSTTNYPGYSYNICLPYNTNAYPYNPCVTGNGYYGNNYYNCSWNNWGSYNPNWYSYGCPAGYIPAQSGVVGTGGFTCVHYIFFQNFYGRNQLYAPSNYAYGAGYTGIGPLQYCDTYTNNSCGSAGGGLRCVSYGSRYGFCSW
ncbi:MAG: hypothetical protein IPM57_09155 [Oligoflexia bacterium]|nr:hypothetical protein [Oligoflexia bacterium]